MRKDAIPPVLAIAILAGAAGLKAQITYPYHHERTPSGKLFLPAGTVLQAAMLETLDSRTARAGEGFRSRLVEPVAVEGRVVVPVGSMVHGVIQDVRHPDARLHHSEIVLVFDSIKTPSGHMIPIAATPMGGDGGIDTGKVMGFLGKTAVKEGANVALGGILTPLYAADYARKGIRYVREDKAVVIPRGSVIALRLDRPAAVYRREGYAPPSQKDHNPNLP